MKALLLQQCLRTSMKISKLFDREATHLLSLTLPYPPSINAYYGTNKFGSFYIKKAGKDYRNTVVDMFKPLIKDTFDFPLRVWVELYVPDRRKRDLDNTKKALLDSLTHAGIWTDDSLIDDLRSVRGELRKGGEVIVHIFRLED